MRTKHIPGLLLLLAGSVLLATCVNLKDITITSPDFGTIANGTYQGKSRVGPVRVELDVTMQNGVITAIQLNRHFNGLGKKAEVIVPRIIEAQTLNVDVISGATGSSKAILLAVENAVTGK